MTVAVCWALAALLAAPATAAAPPPAGGAVPAADGEVLAARLRASGLVAVDALAPGGAEAGAPHPVGAVLRGELPGSGALRVLLVAGCVEDEAASLAGRQLALAVAADLARTPLRHTVELVVCAAPLPPAAAARAWLEAEEASDDVLAALAVEPQGGGAPARLVLLPALSAAGRRLPPAWLAHAVGRGSAATGVAAAAPLAEQLLARYARPRRSSAAVPLLAAGLPALALGERRGPPAAAWTERWQLAITGVVRRLDGLAGRPRDDDRYLVAAGRVWSRRDLYWVGFAAWVALLVRGLPGAWRGAAGGARRRRGRRYLPGFALRVAYLVALLMAPVAAVTLLLPAAVLVLPRWHRAAAVRVARLAALVPAALLAGRAVVAVAAGAIEPWPADGWRLAVVAAALALAVSQIDRPRPARPE